MSETKTPADLFLETWEADNLPSPKNKHRDFGFNDPMQEVREAFRMRPGERDECQKALRAAAAHGHISIVTDFEGRRPCDFTQNDLLALYADLPSVLSGQELDKAQSHIKKFAALRSR